RIPGSGVRGWPSNSNRTASRQRRRSRAAARPRREVCRRGIRNGSLVVAFLGGGADLGGGAGAFPGGGFVAGRRQEIAIAAAGGGERDDDCGNHRPYHNYVGCRSRASWVSARTGSCAVLAWFVLLLTEFSTP